MCSLNATLTQEQLETNLKITSKLHIENGGKEGMPLPMYVQVINSYMQINQSHAGVIYLKVFYLIWQS